MKSAVPITKLAASKGTELHFPPLSLLGLAALVALGHGSVHAQTKVDSPKHGLPGKVRDAMLIPDGAVWWAKRQEDARCRKDLGDAYAAYRKKPTEQTFATLAPLVEKCGRCATATIVRKTERPSGKAPARWYVSDGSCWFGDAKGKEQSLVKIANDLRTVRRYPHKNQGFRAILEFYKTNEAGEKAKEIDRPEAVSPFYAFIAVRGPHLVGPTAATYFVKNEFEAEASFLWLSFQSQARPEKLPKEDLGAAELPVVQAQGQWYVTDAGDLRYTTAADFGIPMPNLADGPARRTLLETLVETLGRGDLEP